MSKELLPISMDRLYDQYIMSPPSDKYDFQFFVKDSVLHVVKDVCGCVGCVLKEEPECGGHLCGSICDAMASEDWHFEIKKELYE